MARKGSEIPSRTRRGDWAALVVILLSIAAVVSHGHAAPRQAPIIGEVQIISIDNAADPWSGGKIVVGGQSVIIPRNFIFDLPANRLTLRQLYTDSPEPCTSTGETGLAKGDTCNKIGVGAIAAILADVSDAGNVIAGQVTLEKAAESVIGNVTFIDHTNGYLRVNGITGDPATGGMVRINDPTGRFTLQQGPGCLPGSPNCSADVRYGVDSDNYTVHFTTGYPACIPSTVTGGFRTAGSDANGVGDPFCPVTNRTVNNGIPVANSFRFAPIRVGDSIAATGNFETIGGVQFLSAHTLRVNVKLTTAPGQPDYMIFEEVGWDVAGFQNRRIRMLLIGNTTLPDSQLDVFAIHFDRTTGQTHEFPIGSTFNNPSTINQGLAPNAGNVFRIRYDVDFLVGTDPELSPCVNIANAGLTPGCPGGGNLFIDQNFAIINPPSRDIIGRTRNKAAFGIGNSVDIQGAPAFNGRYLNPVTLDHPDFAEVNVGALATPFIFTGIPWNLDRRLGPGGCGAGPCEPTDPANPFKFALNPFPFDGLDPRTQAGTPPGVLPSFPGVPANVANKILSYYPFGPTDFFPWDNTTLIPPAQPIVPTPIVELFLIGATPIGSVTLSSTPLSPQFPGARVTFTASPGGTGTYEYKFFLNIGGAGWNEVQPYSTLNTFTWDSTGVPPGINHIAVYARRAGSALPVEAYNHISYDILSTTPTGVTLAATAGTNQVTFTATPSGGSGPFEYTFFLNVGGAGWNEVQPYSTLPTFTWNTVGIPAGTNFVAVYIRRFGSSAPLEAFDDISYPTP